MSKPRQSSLTTGLPFNRKRKSRAKEGKATLKHCHIDDLPVEILAEILSYCRINDILSMARTSKRYCATLAVNPASTYIWKRARAAFTPMPIPDPTPNFTESSYAAFLFDKGPCEMCNKKAKEPLESYSLRLRLCSPACQIAWRTKMMKTVHLHLESAAEVAGPLPFLEQKPTIRNGRITYPTYREYRLRDWLEEKDARNRSTALPSTKTRYLEERLVRIRQMGIVWVLSNKLIDWRDSYKKSSEDLRAANSKLAIDIAKTEGWKVVDLHHCPSFSQLYLAKTSSLEELTRDDFKRIFERVKREIDDIYAHERRREAEQANQEQREAVKSIYSRLKSKPDAVMPSLAAFRRLPFVSRIQACASTPDAVKEIQQSTLVAGLVQDDLARWRAEARASLNAVLGFKPLTESSPTTLEAVDRLTARFRCQRCNSQSKSFPGDGGMSFTEACAHQCEYLSKRASAQTRWNAELFTPDHKAIDAVQQVLMWCGYTADDRLSLEAPDEVGHRIQCMTCPSRIVMTYNNLMSHCHRHDSIQIRIVSVEDANSILQYPSEQCRRTQLTGRSAVAERQKRIYGCRHCQQIRSVPSESDSSSTCETDITAGPLHLSTTASTKLEDVARGSHAGNPAKRMGKPPQLYQFDGLRSHAKEKHGILWLGDEDFYKQLQDEIIP
ncbi:hypothetical protein BC835DRAFT_311744 [Cytidiella melzeri]|nr:hypothetical protein BC835DRAFT_311744 [Cytidiella melzeri]